MTPWLDDGDCVLYHGDALEQLALMPSESVQCIVTSPPFWGLRDYGTGTWEGGDPEHEHDMLRKPSTMNQGFNERWGQGGGQQKQEALSKEGIPARSCSCGARRVDQQIGLEETPDEWCARLVAVMREARRVLRSDGVCWIEVGDTYAAGGTGGASPASTLTGGGGKYREGSQLLAQHETSTTRRAPDGLKPKDLCGAPWLLAFALRADGWYLRSDTIWARPNPMPESVTDRPTKAHSYVFLLSKSARYFYDSDAIRETNSEGAIERFGQNGTISRNQPNSHDGQVGHSQRMPEWQGTGRNARSVWSIPTEPTPFAHFATFPQALVERCIKAGTSEHGACTECGAPWRRITERTIENPGNRSNNGQIDRTTMQRAFEVRREVSVSTLGWEASCDCMFDSEAHKHGEIALASVEPCVVLDPFMGSGTTALVARRLGRHAIGVELNLDYLRISADRLSQLSLLAAPPGSLP